MLTTHLFPSEIIESVPSPPPPSPRHRPRPNRHATHPLNHLIRALASRLRLNERLRDMQFCLLRILLIIRRLREVVRELGHAGSQMPRDDDRIQHVAVFLAVEQVAAVRQRVVDGHVVVVDGKEGVDEAPEVAFAALELLVEDGAVARGRGLFVGLGLGFGVEVLAEDEILEDVEALGGVLDAVVDFEVVDLAVGRVRGVGYLPAQGHHAPDDAGFEAVGGGRGGEVLAVGGFDGEALD